MSQSGQEGQQGGTGGNGPDSGQDQGTGTGAGTDSGQSTGNGGGTGADSGQQNSGTDAGSDTVTREELDKVLARLSEADKKRDTAEKELKAIKDKDLSESEKMKQDLTDMTAERDSLKDEVAKLRLGNAFLSANTITWQNGEVALDIARSKGYLDDVVSDDGKVDSKKMGVQLKKLAEEHKYLVKSQDEGDDAGDSGHGPSGQAAGGRSGNSGDDKAKKDQLKKTFPALGRRV